MALTIAQCFYSIYFHIYTVKYNVLFGLFKFGLCLDLKVLASASTSASSCGLGIGLGLKHLASFNTSGCSRITAQRREYPSNCY